MLNPVLDQDQQISSRHGRLWSVRPDTQQVTDPFSELIGPTRPI
jgi:hypothetical protein